MEPLHYQPEGDPIAHQITAEQVLVEGNGRNFKIRSDGEEIGDIDVELASDELGFITGIGPRERKRINNGYLGPASLAVLACLREDHNFDRLKLFDIEDQPLN